MSFQFAVLGLLMNLGISSFSCSSSGFLFHKPLSVACDYTEVLSFFLDDLQSFLVFLREAPSQTARRLYGCRCSPGAKEPITLILGSGFGNGQKSSHSERSPVLPSLLPALPSGKTGNKEKSCFSSPGLLTCCVNFMS